MSTLRSPIRRVTNAALGVLVVLQATGCISWHPVTTSMRTDAPIDPSDHYRVTTKDQRTVYLEQLHYRNDSILGVLSGVPIARETGLPMSQVATVDRQVKKAVHLPLGAEIALGLVGGAMLGVTSVVLAFSHWH